MCTVNAEVVEKFKKKTYFWGDDIIKHSIYDNLTNIDNSKN